MKSYIFIIIGIIVIILIGGFIFIKQKKSSKKIDKFIKRWTTLQGLCLDQKNWSKVVLQSDKVFSDVLRFKGFKGKNIGERIVAAQHSLSDNDTIWFCHKLANQIMNDKIVITDKKVLIKAINGYRQALIDMSILKKQQ